MPKLLTALLLLIFSLPAAAQKDIEARRNSAGLMLYIPAAVETGPFKYVRTLQGSAKYGEEIYSLYKILRTEAVRLGANCFKLRSYVRNDTTKLMTLTLAVYFADELQRTIISNNQETNCLFLFSDDMFNNTKTTFELDKNKIIVASGHFYKHVIKDDKEVKIAKGGFAGQSLITRWEPEGPSRFFTVSGFKMSSVPVTPFYPAGSIVIPIVVFNTGRLKELDYNFGFLLTELFPVQKESKGIGLHK